MSQNLFRHCSALCLTLLTLNLCAAALTEKNYDVNYCWGIGTHSNKQGGAMLPEMLRWLWRDYPRTDNPQNDANRKFFVPEN